MKKDKLGTKWTSTDIRMTGDEGVEVLISIPGVALLDMGASNGLDMSGKTLAEAARLVAKDLKTRQWQGDFRERIAGPLEEMVQENLGKIWPPKQSLVLETELCDGQEYICNIDIGPWLEQCPVNHIHDFFINNFQQSERDNDSFFGWALSRRAIYPELEKTLDEYYKGDIRFEIMDAPDIDQILSWLMENRAAVTLRALEDDAIVDMDMGMVGEGFRAADKGLLKALARGDGEALKMLRRIIGRDDENGRMFRHYFPSSTAHAETLAAASESGEWEENEPAI